MASVKAAPVIVFVYGGAWNSGRRQDYDFVGDAFAARGFVTVVPDYRLVPQVRFPDFLDDIAQAVRWTRDNVSRFGGDPDRIALVGHSAGAYNAVMVALDETYLERAGVAPDTVSAVAALAGPYDFYPFDETSTIEAFGQYPRPRDTQPISYARPGAPAAFLATGADDDTVKPSNTAKLAASLRRNGVPVVARTYPGIGHVDILLALSRPFRGRAPVLDDVTTFLNERL